MKKILMVTDAWAPQVNGVATTTSALADALRSLGMEVAVVHPGLFSRNYSLPLYPEIQIPFFPGRRMRELFEQEKPDYIHIATEGFLGLSARKYCKKHGTSFTTFYHTHFPLYAPYYLFGGSILSFFLAGYLRWFHNAANAVMVSTNTLKKELESQGYRSVVVTPLGLDASRFVRNEARAPKLELPHPVFVYLGRIAKEKNVEEFLAASLPGGKLVIGDGPDRARLEKKYGGEALFAGYRRGQELVDYLSVADVCVFPSRTETFGLVVLEALACGLPVAAHDVMGPRDILTPGVDGELDEDIAHAATRCLALSRDQCRATATKYSWDTSAKVFLSHIETGV